MDYTITIKDPTGRTILDGAMDATLRKVHHLAVDDDHLHALLVTTSVMAGRIEGECQAAHARTQAARGAVEGRAA